MGKPTDNSGFGGASFASLELEEEKKEQNKGAVQEPNAFLERHLLKSSYALFEILKEKGLIDNIGFKDGFIENKEDHKLSVIKKIREYCPEIVITNAPTDRHPDHGKSSNLTLEACFLSGL